MAERRGSENEGTDPFGMRSAMQRKMRERGDDPASRARAQAERDADTEVTDAEIAELLGPAPGGPHEQGPHEQGPDEQGPDDRAGG